MQRRSDIARMEAPTAAPMASVLWPSTLATATPANAETTLPPKIDQGCASGLAGTANNSTAEAPIGATSKERPPVDFDSRAQPRAVATTHIRAPKDALMRSARLAPASVG